MHKNRACRFITFLATLNASFLKELSVFFHCSEFTELTFFKNYLAGFASQGGS
jgi:hypothetical protein